MAWLLLAVCVACKVLNVVCGLITWLMYMHKVDTRQQHTPTISRTGSSYTSTGDIVEGGHSNESFNNPSLQHESSQL